MIPFVSEDMFDRKKKYPNATKFKLNEFIPTFFVESELENIE